jgi:hypothetical protein
MNTARPLNITGIVTFVALYHDVCIFNFWVEALSLRSHLHILVEARLAVKVQRAIVWRFQDKDA